MPLTCLAIVLSSLAASPAFAPAPTGGRNSGVASDGRPQLEVYLAAHDVPSAAELRALATAPEKALMAIASDPRAEGLIRSRAVASLRLVATQEVSVFLGKLIQSKAKATDATDRLIVRRAAVALGWMAGSGTVEQLATLFDNEDVEVRLDAAIGMGLTRAANAATYLRRQLVIEPSPRVRDQIERQLRALHESPVQPEKAPVTKNGQPMRGSW